MSWLLLPLYLVWLLVKWVFTGAFCAFTFGYLCGFFSRRRNRITSAERGTGNAESQNAAEGGEHPVPPSAFPAPRSP